MAHSAAARRSASARRSAAAQIEASEKSHVMAVERRCRKESPVTGKFV
jgi:hypothetical protein